MKLRGNEHLMALLRRLAAKDKLFHALLLEGEAGSGKKTLARFAAAACLCASAQRKPCLACGPCHKVLGDIHPDVLWYTVPEGKRDFPIAHVREISEGLHLAPSEGRCKVYILDGAHTMNQSSQNALLKMLEEPPSFAVFLLLTENLQTMLETVRSRCRVLSLSVPTVEECAQELSERFPKQSETLLYSAAASAGGNVGRAMALLKEAKPSRADSDSRKLLKLLCRQDWFGTLALLSAYDKQRQELLETLELLRRHLGEAAVRPDRFSEVTITPSQADQAVSVLGDTTGYLRGNGHISLACSVLTERMGEVFRTK